MKMILGFLKPNGGKISVCGELVKYGRTNTNRLVGYLPDVPEYYDYMSPTEYLKLCGEITGLSGTHILSDVERICDTVGILNNGSIALEGKLSNMKDSYRSDHLILEVCQTEKLPVLFTAGLSICCLLAAIALFQKKQI